MKTEFLTLMSRVKSATDAAALLKLEKLATRVYNAGFLTPAEFATVDVSIMENLATLEP